MTRRDFFKRGPVGALGAIPLALSPKPADPTVRRFTHRAKDGSTVSGFVGIALEDVRAGDVVEVVTRSTIPCTYTWWRNRK